MKLSDRMLEYLNTAATGEYLPEDRTRKALQDRGLVDDKGEITPEGVTAYEENGGECTMLNYLELGSPVTVLTKEGRVRLGVGSKLQILFREELDRTKYYSCYVPGLPVVLVGQNSKHKFASFKIPSDYPLDKLTQRV